MSDSDVSTKQQQNHLGDGVVSDYGPMEMNSKYSFLEQSFGSGGNDEVNLRAFLQREKPTNEICNIDISQMNQNKENVPIRPNSIFWVPSGDLSLCSRALQRKSLAQLGYCPPSDLKCVTQTGKKTISKLIIEILKKGKYPDVFVRIGSNRYPCQMCILQCYSDYFKKFSLGDEITIPDGYLTERVFESIYKWMILDEAILPYDSLVELFYASRVLEIPELTKVAWNYFDSDSVHLREDAALLFYLKARKYQLLDLQAGLIQRITSFFLTLVASKEFVQMKPDEIVWLLSSNNIGVNTEVEAFLSAIRWLNYDRKNREPHLPKVMECIRFGVIPAWYLLQIQKKSIGSSEIDWIADNEYVLNIIERAMIYSVAHQHYAASPEGFVQWLNEEGLDRIVERQYIYDKGCIYHHRLKCPHMHIVTFNMFEKYLQEIATIGRDFWHCMEPSLCDVPCGCTKRN